MRLFDVAAEYRQAADTLAELDVPPETVTDTLESLSGDLTTKATNVAMVAANARALARAIGEAEARMAERRRALVARAERIEDYILQSMLYAGVERIESPHLRLAVRTNPPAVDIFDVAQVPPGFLRDVASPPPEVDKAAVRTAIAAGMDVPGARLTHRKRVVIG